MGKERETKIYHVKQTQTPFDEYDYCTNGIVPIELITQTIYHVYCNFSVFTEYFLIWNMHSNMHRLHMGSLISNYKGDTHANT